jgi:hypothetical protein
MRRLMRGETILKKVVYGMDSLFHKVPGVRLRNTGRQNLRGPLVRLAQTLSLDKIPWRRPPYHPSAFAAAPSPRQRARSGLCASAGTPEK